MTDAKHLQDETPGLPTLVATAAWVLARRRSWEVPTNGEVTELLAAALAHHLATTGTAYEVEAADVLERARAAGANMVASVRLALGEEVARH